MQAKKQQKTSKIKAQVFLRIGPNMKWVIDSMAEQDEMSVPDFMLSLARDEAKRRGIPIARPEPQD